MGADNSAYEVKGKERVVNSHPFQQGSVMVEQGGRRYIQSSFACSEPVYNKWRANVGTALGTPQGSFAYLPSDMGFLPDDDPLKNNGFAVVNYPECPYTLSDEIKRRKVKNQSFKERDLYYLLFALAATKKDADLRAEPLGDVRPENVFLSRSGDTKIATINSFPYERTAYEKLVDEKSPSYKVLLAPEDLEASRHAKLDNRHNKQSEMFSMGATMIGAGILDDMSSLYDYSNRQFRYDQHSIKTSEWLEHPKYSEILKSVVLSMCNPIPEKRIKAQELWNFLNTYAVNITNKQQFIINNPPESIESGVSVVRSSILRSRMK